MRAQMINPLEIVAETIAFAITGTIEAFAEGIKKHFLNADGSVNNEAVEELKKNLKSQAVDTEEARREIEQALKDIDDMQKSYELSRK